MLKQFEDNMKIDVYQYSLSLAKSIHYCEVGRKPWHVLQPK